MPTRSQRENPASWRFRLREENLTAVRFTTLNGFPADTAVCAWNWKVVEV
jgi:hypothetical protein